MNEEYLKGLHNYLNIDDDYDTWVSSISGNEEYLKGLHGYLKIDDDYDTWNSSVFGDELQSDTIEVDIETQPEKELVAETVTEPEEEQSFLNKGTDILLNVFQTISPVSGTLAKGGKLFYDELSKESETDSYIVDAGLKFGSTVVDTFLKGSIEAKKMLNLQTMELALGLSDFDYTDEQKRSAIIAYDKLLDSGYLSPTAAEQFAVKGLDKASDYLSSKQMKFDNESFLDDIEQGNYEQAAKRSLSQAFGSLPTTLAAYSGLPGLLWMATGLSGQKFEEEFRKPENSEKPIWQLSLNALATGATETTFELVTRGIGKRLGFVADSRGLEAAKKLSQSYAKRILTRFGIDPAKEGFSEAFTRLSTDLIDAITLSEDGGFSLDKFTKAFDFSKTLKGMAEEGVLGVLSGQGMGAVSSLKSSNLMEQEAAALSLMPYKQRAGIVKIGEYVRDLQNQLKGANESESKVLNNLIDEAVRKQKEIKTFSFNELINMEQSELNKYALNMDKIKENLNLLNSDKPDVVKKAKKNIESLSDDNKILLDKSNEIEKQRKINFIEEQGDLVLKAGNIADQDKIDRAIREIESETGIEVDRSQIETNPENFKIEIINENNVDEILDKYSKDKTLFSKKDLLESAEGTYLANQGVILMSEDAALGVLEHEGVHNYFDIALNKLGNEDAVFGIAKVMMDKMKTVDPESAAFVDMILKKYYETDSRYKAKDVAEEVLTYYAENKVKYNQFNKNDIASSKLATSIRRLFQNSFNLNNVELTEDNVMRFIDDYLVAIEKGSLTKFQERFAKGEVEISESLKEKGRKIARKKRVEDLRKQEEVDKVEDTKETGKFSKKASDNVQQIYQEQGIGGALDIINEFKPIVNKIVQRRSEAPGFDRQLLTDEIETGKGGILDLITKYNPDSGVPLAAFINKYLPVRAIEASRRVLSEVFESDISERVDIAEPTSKVEEVEITEKTKEPTNLRRSLDIEEGGDLYNKVKEVVAKTFGTKIPAATDPAFKKKLQDTYASELMSDVKELMGKPGSDKYKTFLQEYGEQIYDLLPQDILNKSYQNFIVEKKNNLSPTEVDKAISDGLLPGDTPRTSGPSLFTKESFNQQKWVDYHLAPTKGRPASKQTQLAQTIAKELGKDATLEVLEDPKVFERFTAVEEIQGREVTKETKPKIAEKIKREPGVKFSKKVNSKNLKESANYKIVKDKNGDTVFRSNNVSKTRAEKMAEWVEGFIYKNPKDKGRTYRTRDLNQKLPNDIAIEEGETVKDGIVRVTNKFIKENPSFYKAIKESVTAGVERGLLSTKTIFDKLIDSVSDVEQVGKRYPYTKTGGFAKPDFVKSISENNYIKDQLQQVDNFIEFFEKIQNYLAKNPNDAWYFDALVKDAQDNQNSVFRYSSPVLLMHVDTKGNFVLNEPLREEHSSPQNNVATMLLDAAINGNVNNIEPVIKAMLMQGGLTKVDDTKLDVDFKSTMPDFFWEEIVPKILSGKVKVESGIAAVIRMTEAGVNMDNYKYIPANKTFSEYLFGSNGIPQVDQAKLTRDYLSGNITLNESRKLGKEIAKAYSKTDNKVKQSKKINEKELSNSVIKFSKTETNQDIIGYAKTVDEALSFARNPNAPVKKIRVFDFDDTLAQTKSIVFYTKADGTEGQLTAEEFAEKGADLVAEGAVMDFSDFNIVRDGKRGPLFDIAKKIEKARGTEDVFVLTARAPESQQAIHEFLKSEGLNIPIENITGLGNSTGAAKANWIVDKAADGYNDFYFADDAYQNVKAVQDALSQLDVKSKVQQAKVKFSKSVNQDFNKIIEQTTGIASEKEYSKAKAKVRGAGKGNKKFFIPYSAEDFMGLIYPLLSKGKLGDSQMAWFKQNLLDPYARAVENLSTDRLQLMEDFKALKKALEVPKNLRKENDTGFTNEQAVRVYLFNKMGYETPGLSKTDLQDLIDVVNSDGLLKAFADQLMNITKGDGYAKPGQSWLAGTITTDLIDVLNTVKRKKYLEQSGFLENADLIFSETNLNKLEAAYGEKYREAMENILKRMKSGKNRLFSGNRLSNRVLDYINGSIGAIMFFNARSAVLQTISAVNFVNWSFNNPIKAGKAFANQKQYWSDFMQLMNSDYLMDRRNGLKLNISESEIADAAATSKNKAKAAISYILQKGFLPTQIADSFAIASGGATFYRNRINDLIKNEGLTEAEAKKKAMLEFRQIAEQSQQSSDPSKISAQQASDLGRVILAFANTPMQYARLQKRAAQDLINGRGDAKSHVSKIIYYGVVQNIIFNALQQSLFALGFGDDEDEMTAKELEAHEKDKNKRYYKIANGMLDSQLRGLGIAGATVGVVKNFLLDIYERSGRKRPEYVDAVYKLLQISPPISSKISKVRQAAYQFDSKKRREEIFEKGFSLDNPAYEASAKVISATTNIPLDRLYSKVNNIDAALAEDTETWQSIAMLAGWPEWQIKPKDKKQSSKSSKKKEVKYIEPIIFKGPR